MDFACIHMYGDQWLSGRGDASVLEWSVQWVQSHMEGAARLGKRLCLQVSLPMRRDHGRTPKLPTLVLNSPCPPGFSDCASSSASSQEFGKKPAGTARLALFQVVGGLAVRSSRSRGVLNGMLVWMLAHEAYPDCEPAAAG